MNDTQTILPPDFDPNWYLAAYPDVRQAKIDPAEHYVTYGYAEGRLPVRVKALELDHILWRGFESRALQDLFVLQQQGSSREQAVAGWVMARWFASLGEWSRAYRQIMQFLRRQEGWQTIPHAGPFLLGIDICLKCGDLVAAQALRHRLRLLGHPASGQLRIAANSADLILVDVLLARAGAKDTPDVDALDHELKLNALLAKLHAPHGLEPVILRAETGTLFDRLGTAESMRVRLPEQMPLVSVIVPVFNSENTLSVALDSLCKQEWPALEILVVDDNSQDASLRVAQNWAARDSRIKVLAQEINQGAYPTRNIGLAAAQGAFITVHDADDWSHPAKIRLQAEALIAQPEIKASASHWVRCSADLDMTLWRMETGWVYRNVSSLMVRAELRDSLGYWDRVRANADTEYYHRVQMVYGSHSICEVSPGIPLAFGRTEPQSLTMQSKTHLRTQFAGVRRNYLDAALYWQKSTFAANTSLYLPQFPKTRPFRVPADIGPIDPPGAPSALEQIADSEKFDADWYKLAYPDVLMADTPPAQHYLEHGGLEGRDPGPLFSSGRYRQAYDLASHSSPLLHWEQKGRRLALTPLPSIAGALISETPRVLVFAHMVSHVLAGAEHSFLNLLQRLVDLKLTPVVVVPSIHNPEYIEALRNLCSEIEILPQLWRHGTRKPPSDTIKAIGGLIQRHSAQAVYVNTIVLDAPLIAARAEGCEAVVNVRELPAEDVELCQILGMSAEELRDSILTEADWFIANSEAVAQWLNQPDRTKIWPNVVAEELFSMPTRPADLLRVGLVSSNILKKGLADFLDVAKRVEAAGDPARFLLIGPSSPDLEALRPWPSNVEHTGYVPTAQAAISQVDLVMSLSHFAESFGRTVLEAMAAGRPVICYNRGTPPALVEGRPDQFGPPGGIVVPADSPATAARAVLALSAARHGFSDMSVAARARAQCLQREAQKAHL